MTEFSALLAEQAPEDVGQSGPLGLLLTVIGSSAGRIWKCPASSPSNRPSTGGLSNRGRHNQSTDPPLVTRAPTSSGLCSARVMPISPPIDQPSTVGFSRPSASISPAVSPAISWIVIRCLRSSVLGISVEA